MRRRALVVMARFDAHENPSRRSHARVVYLLDIQADMLSALATRLVVPLVPKTGTIHSRSA